MTSANDITMCSTPSPRCVKTQSKASVPTVPCGHKEGKEMPVIGFGCAMGNWGDKSKWIGFQPDLGWAAFPKAVNSGYTHFDCAFAYGTHNILGMTLGQKFASGELKREDVWVTTKVFHPPSGGMSLDNYPRTFVEMPSADMPIEELKDRMRRDIHHSLAELNLGYVDLLLMHFAGCPGTRGAEGMKEKNDAMRKAVWEVFEEQYEIGKCKAIGVSNFDQGHLEELMKTAKVMPMVNQIEVNPFITQTKTVEFCKKNNIVVQAWGPLGADPATGVLGDETLKKIAASQNKNVGQIILRWIYQLGLVSVPKSQNEARMAGNLDIFGFELSEQEMSTISALDKNKSCAGPEGMNLCDMIA